MKGSIYTRLIILFVSCSALNVSAEVKRSCPEGFNDEPAMARHIEQSDINSGKLNFDEITDHGENLFISKFNTCDGQGRPLTTGAGDARSLPIFSQEGEPLSEGQIAKLRTSAPDSDACAGCHNEPEVGGSGDFVANVFVLAQAMDPPTSSVSSLNSNSRNTLGMHGSGPIEMLAREMTQELHAQFIGLPDGVHTLSTKGVEFEIEIEHGAVIEAKGIDHDLIVKPFHQAGKVISLREFSNNAMNHHHGMQAEERFDLNPIKGMNPDFDGDGVERELTIGDQTAITVWQAQLSVPQQIMPINPHEKRLVRQGKQLFDDVGCTSCHKPKMVLNSRYFIEPNPFNPPGTCAGDFDGCPEYYWNMTKQGDKPRLQKGPKGTAIVRAYTDLKRHNLCDEPGPDAIRFFCNEQLAQGRPDQDGKPGTEYFLTRRLWDVGSSAPYGHRGDITTIFEAIDYHGGEARESRDAYMNLTNAEQKAVVKFLKTLQVIPQNKINKHRLSHHD